MNNDSLSLLQRIKSFYICKRLFGFIDDPNFKLKLFSYSKYMQEKFNLSLLNYKVENISQMKLNFQKYIISKEEYPYSKYDKNSFKKELDKDMSKYKTDINVIKINAIQYFENSFQVYKKKIGPDPTYYYDLYDIKIDIFSPLIALISVENIFEEIFTIYFPLEIIKKYSLENDYILKFEELNTINSKYSSILFELYNDYDCYFLTKYKIKFSQIKRLNFILRDDLILHNYNTFFQTLFSYEDIQNNLKYLRIEFYNKSEVSSNSFEYLNNFKSLKHLFLKRFIFQTTFTLNIKDLENLTLMNCQNITFNENSSHNLKSLYLGAHCIIIKQTELIKLPSLEILKLDPLSFGYRKKYNDILDFKNLKNLRILFSGIIDFLCLGDSLLEELNIIDKDSSYFELEVKMLKKIISIKTIKKLNIDLSFIDDNEISKISGENTSVEKLSISHIPNFTFYNLQNKFPNLSKLEIIHIDIFNKKESINLDIKEKSNLKMKKINLKGETKNDLKLYIQSYENLESISIILNVAISNLKNAIPLFNEECKKEFKSLKKFKFYNEINEMNIDSIKNLFSNFDKMPNLKKFGLICFSKDITEDLYIQFVKKLLSLNLKFLVLKIITTKGDHIIIEEDYDNNDEKYYSKNELKELCPNLNYYRYKIIKIYKYKK